MISWFILFLVVLYTRIIFRLKVTGRSNLRAAGGRGCFLISNHTLYLDPAVIGSAIAPRRARYTAMQKTFAMPFVGNFIRYLGAFPIPEDNPLGRLSRPVRQLIEEGWFVHFFPEGDLKHRNQSPARFSPGVFLFAQVLKRPVIPVTIVLLPVTLFGRLLSARFFRVKAVIGEPIRPERFAGPGKTLRASVLDMMEHAQGAMEECIRRERGPYYKEEVGLAG